MTAPPPADARRVRWAAAAGAAGPIGFLMVSFAMAALRRDVVASGGWVSWPSSMATGGPPAAVPQILAFCWLGGCYAVFAIFALAPVLRAPVVTGSFLAVALGDLMLAFPTDVAGSPGTWHGTLHLGGVLIATVATVVASAASLVVVRHRPGWGPWRAAAPVVFVAALVGAFGGFDAGAAKVIYVVGITLPVPVLAWEVGRTAS